MFRLIIGLILVALPFLELALLIKVGRLAGFWATLGMLVGAAVLGGLVVSRQSMGALRRATQAMGQGQPPVADVLDGAFLLMAGMLLITPGFVSDVFGLLLLVPPLRRALARWTVARARARGGLGEATPGSGSERAGDPAPAAPVDQGKGPIIEGEFERLGETPTDPQDPKR